MQHNEIGEKELIINHSNKFKKSYDFTQQN